MYLLLLVTCSSVPLLQIKKLRLKLLSSVNHPVNAIAPHTKQHLLDKVQRLKKLLEGRVVTTADRTVSTKDHPLALDYCTKELADKLVVCDIVVCYLHVLASCF